MPKSSIVIKSTDRYSESVKKMATVTKSFSKDVDTMEKLIQGSYSHYDACKQVSRLLGHERAEVTRIELHLLGEKTCKQRCK